MGHCSAGLLFAVAQGRIKNQDAGLSAYRGHKKSPLFFSEAVFGRLATERSRPRHAQSKVRSSNPWDFKAKARTKVI